MFGKYPVSFFAVIDICDGHNFLQIFFLLNLTSSSQFYTLFRHINFSTVWCSEKKTTKWMMKCYFVSHHLLTPSEIFVGTRPVLLINFTSSKWSILLVYVTNTTLSVNKHITLGNIYSYHPSVKLVISASLMRLKSAFITEIK